MNKKKIIDFIESLELLFDLSNYERTIKFEERDEDETAATIAIDEQYQRYTIKIYPCLFTYPLKTQRKYLLHEFCHKLVSPLQDDLVDISKGNFIPEWILKEHVEKVTSNIEIILDGLLQNKKNYAKQAYNKYLS